MACNIGDASAKSLRYAANGIPFGPGAVFGVSSKQLKKLNPALTRHVWKGWRPVPKHYRLRLPLKQGGWASQVKRLNAKAPERGRLAKRAFTQWNQQPGDATGEAILIDTDRRLMETAIEALLQRRDDRPFTIKE